MEPMVVHVLGVRMEIHARYVWSVLYCLYKELHEGHCGLKFSRWDSLGPFSASEEDPQAVTRSRVDDDTGLAYYA